MAAGGLVAPEYWPAPGVRRRYVAPVSVADLDAWLLTGPRGRRLCWELLQGPPQTRTFDEIWFSTSIPDAVLLAADLSEGVDRWLAEGHPDAIADPRLYEAFADSVAWARYWQEPDFIDQALALPSVSDALIPLAEALVSRLPMWWSEPVKLDSQYTVQWLEPEVGRTRVSLDGAVAKLAAWSQGTLEDERRSAERPRDVRASYSGAWWSTPALSDLPKTTRATADAGVIGLSLVEDGMGWEQAQTQRVTCIKPPRVFEIRDGVDWVRLTERYPLEVSLSRRHDWWRTTGVEGRWLMPDYQAVSVDYDAVHLTTRAYLTAATRALCVGSAFTMVAGWDPDQTYWLTDCLAPTGPPEFWTWHRDAEPALWLRANR
jgi:hypothetical protein